jgi:hypothetical protein
MALRQWLCLCVLALIIAAATAAPRELRAVDAPAVPGVLAGLKNRVVGTVKDTVGKVVLCKVDCLSGKAKFVYQDAKQLLPICLAPSPCT